MPRLSLDILDVKSFLRLPEFRPYFEFIDGRVVQKFAKDLPRSVIQIGLATAINDFARSRKLGRAFVSLRVVCGGSALVPEVSFFGTGRVPKHVRGQEAIEVTTPPDIAMEFLAPRQRAAEPQRKLRHLIKHGGKLGWLIDTKRERISILRPGRSIEILEAAGILSGEDVLPGFSLSLEEIFDWLDQD
jgi:Uma2 family endonuclease